MNKLVWVLIVGGVIITGVYFVITKNGNTSDESVPVSAEQQDIKTTAPSQQKNTPTKTKSTTNTTGGIPQPPKLPE